MREIYTLLLFPAQEWTAFEKSRELARAVPEKKKLYEDYVIWFEIARNYFHGTYYDHAMEIFQKTIDAGLSNAKVLFHLGKAYHIRGDYEKARGLFEQALEKGEPAMFKLKARDWLAFPPYAPEGGASPAASPAPPSGEVPAAPGH